ncbi:MAG: CaiB/BaiF CoA transferase family protein [Flavobacteriaceae bacterium]
MTASNGRPVLPDPVKRPAGAPLALEGIRVLDLTRLMAGPIATMFLADLGAEIIKIEHPVGGDNMRAVRPAEIEGEGSFYVFSNRNKKSITLDLSTEEGKQILRELAAECDVVAENFSAGVMDRLGFSYEELKKINPQIIYCAVSAFGRSGPYAYRPGYDQIAQAEAGFLSLNGFRDGEPCRTGAPVIDSATAMMACNAILGALMARERHGIGQYVEVALFDTAVFLDSQFGMNYLMTGKEQYRTGNGSVQSDPVGIFYAKDGPIYLNVLSEKEFRLFARDVLRMPELAESPDYANAASRKKNNEALFAIINDVFGKETREEILGRCNKSGVPAGAMNTIKEAFDSDEMKERRICSQIPHPKAGTVPNIAPPFRFHGTPLADPVAAPMMGQHTDEILKNVLGYGPDKIEQLAATGVFGARPNAA